MRKHLFYLGRGLLLILLILVVPFLINENAGVALLIIYLAPSFLVASLTSPKAILIVATLQTLGLAYLIGRQKPFIIKSTLLAAAFYTVEIAIGMFIIGLAGAVPGL